MKLFHRQPFVPFYSFSGKCQDEGSSGGGDDAAELGIGATLEFNFPAICSSRAFLITANVGGVFLVLGFGCLFALIVAAAEFLWNVKKVAVEEKVELLKVS